jgi:hypothetical protein
MCETSSEFEATVVRVARTLLIPLSPPLAPWRPHEAPTGLSRGGGASPSPAHRHWNFVVRLGEQRVPPSHT